MRGDGGVLRSHLPIRCPANRLAHRAGAKPKLPSTTSTSVANSPAATPRLHSPLLRPSRFLPVRRQHAVDNTICGLNGSARCVATTTKAASEPPLTTRIARPATALLPFRAGSAAFLSSSSSDKAATMKSPAIIPGNPGTPPPMKAAVRREVPLPSQEGKKGAMQYALYVRPLHQQQKKRGSNIG
jgi:hypothetical protein